jgi:S-adenosylmethionine synthetase
MKIKTSEVVSDGHPDKVADYLSDSVLDYYLNYDKDARVACETLIKDNKVIFAGEISSTASEPDYNKIVKDCLSEIGYVGQYSLGEIEVTNLIGKQSPDIAVGVDCSMDDKDVGAGDQGIMFGYATNETDDLLPLPYVLARDILLKLKEIRKIDNRLGPDAKSQVSIKYNDSNLPLECVGVVLSTQHCEEFELENLRKFLLEYVIKPVLGKYYTSNTKLYINATGKFVIGGPIGDCGLTGRKIVVDQYGGFAPVGGGAQSGKDPTKVDRSALYFARWVASKCVSNHLADEVLIEVAYSIGVSKPVAINITCNKNYIGVSEYVNKFDFRPSSIIQTLNLKQPFYKLSTNYGHFSNKLLPWNIY